MSCDIPVVDFASVLTVSGGEQREERNGVIQELHSAFTTVGFVFIKNHGISEALVDLWHVWLVDSGPSILLHISADF